MLRHVHESRCLPRLLGSSCSLLRHADAAARCGSPCRFRRLLCISRPTLSRLALFPCGGGAFSRWLGHRRQRQRRRRRRRRRLLARASRPFPRRCTRRVLKPKLASFFTPELRPAVRKRIWWWWPAEETQSQMSQHATLRISLRYEIRQTMIRNMTKDLPCRRGDAGLLCRTLGRRRVTTLGTRASVAESGSRRLG